jgi:hypothetical protein
MLIAHKQCVPWLFSGSKRAAFVTTITLLPILLGCGALDKDSNCLNEKAGCFKKDVTPPKLYSSAPDITKSYTTLDFIDITFTEEVKNGEDTSAYSLPQTGGAANGLKIQSVQKISSNTYRVFLGGASIATGDIDVYFSGIKDYGGNLLSGQTFVRYTGSANIPITLSVTYSGAVVSGVSNNGGGAYSNVDITFLHKFTADNANTYNIYLTTGATTCSGTVLGTGTNLGANTSITPINRVATGFPAANNRIVVCVANQNNPTAVGVASWQIFRDDGVPSVAYDIPPDNYPNPQNITLTCSDAHVDKIAYTSAIQQTSPPAAPVAPGFDAVGGINGTSNIYTGALQATNPANPTYTIFRWQCIDKSGNRSVVPAGVQYYVDNTIPAVNVTLDSSYRAYISNAVNPTTTLKFATDQVSRTYNIRRNGTTCTGGGDGTLLVTGTTPATAGTTITQVLNTTTHFAVPDTVYPVRICVAGPTSVWGTAFLQVTRDDTLPLLTTTVATGTYGAVQVVEFICTDTNLDKAAYKISTQLGNSAPAAPGAPTFDTTTGAITSATTLQGPYTTPDSSTTLVKYGCIDLAGNQATVGNAQYTVDGTIPAVTFVSTDHTGATTNAGGYSNVTITWNTSRAGVGYSPASNFDIRAGATDCATGTIVASGLSSATAGANNITSIPAGSFSVGVNAMKICVKNYAGAYGYQTTGLTITRDDTNPIFTGLSAITSPTSGSYTISWPAATDSGSGVAFYRIYQSTSSLTYGTTPDYIVAGPATSFTVTGLNPLTPYYFVAGAVDNAGNETKIVTLAAEMKSKPTITLVVTGLGAGSFNLTDGTTLATISANTAGTIWTTTLGAGATYNFAFSSQPTGQVCAMKELQFGSLSTSLTLNINCVNGYTVGQNLNAAPAVKLGYHLFQGKNTAVAGTPLTPGFTSTTFKYPEYLAHLNGYLYVADTNNFAIRKIDLSNNSVTTVIGTGVTSTGTPADDGNGTCGVALLGQPMGLATDGTNLYVAEFNRHRIRKISDVNGAGCRITTLAGSGTAGYVDGAADSAQFDSPRQIAANKDYVFVADNLRHRIRRISLASGMVDTLAGSGAASDANGTGTGASIANPVGLTLVGTTLYVSSGLNHIFSIDINTGVGTIVAGDGTAGYIDATGLTARFDGIYSMTTDGEDLYVAEVNNHLIRRVEISKNFRVTTISGAPGASGEVTGATGVSARFSTPHGMATDGRSLFVANHGSHTIRKISDNGVVGYWPLNGMPKDYSSDGVGSFAMTPTGSPTLVTGPTGGSDIAYHLDGTSWFSTASQSQLNLSTEYSIGVWVRPTNTTGARIVDKVTGGSCDGYMVDFQPGNQVRFLYCILGAGQFTSNTRVPINQWTHVLVTFSSSARRARIYINGHLDSEVQTPAGTTGTNGQPLRIGTDSSGIFNFNGDIAGVRLYSRALNEGEINELAQDALQSQVSNGFNTGATGLLAHYEFNAGVENLPAGPLGGNLTISGPKTAITGKDGDPNGSISFNGTSNYFQGTDTGLPGGNAPRTICAWLNPQAYPGSAMMASYGANSNNNAFGLYMLGNTNIGLSAWNNDILANATIPLNTWSHVCGAYNGTTATIYRDGVALTSGPFTAMAVLATTGNNLIIGRNAGSSGAGFFPGKIDDVRIYNRALNVAEVRQLATQVPAGLAARYDFNGDTNDVSGWGNALTATSPAPALIADRFASNSSAYNFSGGGEFRTAAPVTYATDNLALSAWVRPTAYAANLQYIAVNGTGGNGYGLLIDGTAGNVIKGILGSIGFLTTTYTPPLNVWTHVAMVRTAGTWSIYINGASLSLSGISSGTTPLAPDTGSFIASDTGNALYLTGSIDDVRFYAQALSAAELRALAGYHPMQVTNALTTLRMHMQADALSNLGNNVALADGDLWKDSAPASMANGVAASGPRHFDATGGIGGRDAIGFAGGYFDFGTPSISYNGLAICGVYSVLSASGYGGIIEKRDAGGALCAPANTSPCSFGLLQEISGSDTKLEWNGANAYTATSAFNENLLMCHIVPGTTGGTTAYKAGSAVATNPTSTTPFGSGATNSYPLRVGNRSTANSPFSGKIGDLLLYTVPLTSVSVYGAPYTDREIVQCYLSAKYSIPLAGGVVCP